ncbi:translation initiation factor eIF-2B subunit gamma-like [Camellia sinensis]|uniref:translation initiation factor eIF-2B subunit gamma-like n=1 Tax=Camellia sinensis TaxID=4442 RepID=UPI001035A2A3|nr:translation initiation factor eIF-2B subunit gamma-like [Camellia sinensis]
MRKCRHSLTLLLTLSLSCSLFLSEVRLFFSLLLSYSSSILLQFSDSSSILKFDFEHSSVIYLHGFGTIRLLRSEFAFEHSSVIYLRGFGTLWLLRSEVVAVPEDVGTTGALRAIGHHLTTHDILVMSGDLVCDVPPGAVAAAHRRHDAVVTAMLCSARVSGPSDSGSAGGKDKCKKPGRYNIIGLDPTQQFLLFIAAGAEVEKDIRVQKSILRAVGQEW